MTSIQPMTDQSDPWAVRPWKIMRLNAQGQWQTIAQYGQRNEAENHYRFIKRAVPSGNFKLVFELLEANR